MSVSTLNLLGLRGRALLAVVFPLYLSTLGRCVRGIPIQTHPPSRGRLGGGACPSVSVWVFSPIPLP